MSEKAAPMVVRAARMIRDRYYRELSTRGEWPDRDLWATLDNALKAYDQPDPPPGAGRQGDQR